MNKQKIVKMLGIFLIGVLLSSGISYGLVGTEDEFLRYFVLIFISYNIVVYYLGRKESENTRLNELEELLEKKNVDERVITLEKILQESDEVMTEQEIVIKNYEEMLDEASVKFPCNCGQNMFDGIFKPQEEFLVECDFCKNKYAIMLKLETVLITEPIEDLNIDKLIKQNI